MRVVKWLAGVGLVLLLITAGVAWTQRSLLHTWWAVRGLKQASEADRAVWIERVSQLGEPVVMSLVECLVEEGETSWPNIVEALDVLAQRDCAESILEQLARPFAKLPLECRAELLRRVLTWATSPPGLSLAAKLVEQVCDMPEPSLQEPALQLAQRLVTSGRAQDGIVRELIQATLRSPSPAVRLAAIRLAVQPQLQMLDSIVGLLRDPSVEVRRAAIVAVGPAEQVAREEVLIAGLHDTDEEVRKLTEAALLGRGLQPKHLELARLLTHPLPTTRLQVLDRIRDMLDDESDDLDPGVWMRRLSHDPSPAVRAAALRLMSQQTVVDLSDRVEQMARHDPSPTVVQLAQFYRRQRMASSKAR